MGEREGGGTREEVGEREGRGRERVMVSALVIGRRGRGNESGMVENRKGERQREGREKGERLKSSRVCNNSNSNCWHNQHSHTLSPDHSHQTPVTLSECSLPPGSELVLLGALVPLGLREYSAVGNEHNWTSAELLLQLSH